MKENKPRPKDKPNISLKFVEFITVSSTYPSTVKKNSYSLLQTKKGSVKPELLQLVEFIIILYIFCRFLSLLHAIIGH